MFNLAEYRNKPQSLADFLPWAAVRSAGNAEQKHALPGGEWRGKTCQAFSCHAPESCSHRWSSNPSYRMPAMLKPGQTFQTVASISAGNALHIHRLGQLSESPR
jgi:hypothetical protein